MAKTDDRVKFFQDIGELIWHLKSEKIELMPTCFYRSPQEQEILYAQGKSKTLNSRHREWLAMDFVLIRHGLPIWNRDVAYDRAGELWKGMGHTWGGDWESLGDIYHFEF